MASEKDEVDIVSLQAWASEFQKSGVLDITRTVNAIDPSKRSSRVPYELIFKILTMTLPSGSSAVKGHTRPSMIRPFMASKQLYKDARTLLKNRGSWWLECDLRGSRLELHTPPNWIAESITTLSLLIYTPDLQLSMISSNYKTETALLAAVMAIRKTCPWLRSIFLLHRPSIFYPEIDGVNLENRYLHIGAMQNEVLLGWLPETVTHRAAWVQYGAEDAEPELLADRMIGKPQLTPLFGDERVLCLPNKTALKILPPGGEWIDLYAKVKLMDAELKVDEFLQKDLSKHWKIMSGYSHAGS